MQCNVAAHAVVASHGAWLPVQPYPQHFLILDATSLKPHFSQPFNRMAEVAGLVIGGISLAAIFDQCITIIKYVDSGKDCNEDYQDAALMLTLLGGRLNRWERTL